MIFRPTPLLSTAIVATLAAASAAHADTRLQASSGAQYSNGDYGDSTSTSALVIPFSVRASFGSWSIRASVPYITADGTANLSELIDDHGGSSGSGSGSSSSSGSGSSGSGSSGSGSGSGGSGDSDDDDDDVVTSNNRTASGIGDATLAMTYSFDDIANSAAYLDLTGRARFPTGSESDGLSVGTTDYFAVTELGWDGDAAGVFVSGGRRFLGNSESTDRVDGWQASFGGWLNLAETVVVGAYYDWRNSSVRGGEDPSSVDAYVAWRVNNAWKIEFNGGVGLSNASADYTAGVTLIWRSGSF